MANDLFGRAVIEGLTLDDFYGGEPDMLDSDIFATPEINPDMTKPKSKPKTKTLGTLPAPPIAAPTPKTFPYKMDRGPVGQPLPVSQPNTTGPGEERLINNMTTDSYRTQLLRHEGRTSPDGEGNMHEIYRDASGYSTGYGHFMRPQDWEELGVDPNDKQAIAQARVPDEWARERFTEDSEQALQSANQMLSEAGIPATGPISSIIANMTYQMGSQGVKQFSGMWDALRKGDTRRAAVEMRDSQWNKQTNKRSEELAAQMEAIGPLKLGMRS